MKFPKLKENQFAVVAAEGKTGIILNYDFEYHNNILKEDMYYIFEDFDSAKEFAQNTSVANISIELIIYNYKQTVVDFIRSRF